MKTLTQQIQNTVRRVKRSLDAIMTFQVRHLQPVVVRVRRVERSLSKQAVELNLINVVHLIRNAGSIS